MRNVTTGLLIAGLLAPSGASALGIGEIKLHSYLNQPLQAEIPLVLSGEPLNEVRIGLASPAEFAKLGLQRPAWLNRLRFETAQKRDGTFIIRVRSTDVVTEPFVSFLVELNWPDGRIVRSFTVLLDPPDVLRQSSPQTSSHGAEYAATGASNGAVGSASRTASNPTGETDSNLETPRRLREPYGPIARNEKLWTIAERLNTDPSVTTEAMVQALFRLNPQAFNRGNINSLVAGAYLRIPDSVDGRRTEPPLSALDRTSAVSAASRGEVAVPNESAEFPTNARSRGERSPAEAPPRSTGTLGLVRSPDGEAFEKLRRENEQIRLRMSELEKRIGELTRLLETRTAIQTYERQIKVTPPPPIPADETQPPKPATVTLPSDPATPEQPATPAERDTAGRELTVQAEGVVKAGVETAAGAGSETPGQTALPATTPSPEPPAVKIPKVSSGSGVVSRPSDGKAGSGEVRDDGAFSWAWLLAAIATLGAAAGGTVLRRRRLQGNLAANPNGMPAAAVTEPPPQATKSIARSSPAGLINPAVTDPLVVGETASASSVSAERAIRSMEQDITDALFEADIYLSYGKCRQAEESCKKAIALAPDRAASRLKLLEVYAAASDRVAFSELCKQLRRNPQFSDPEFWTQVEPLANRVGYSEPTDSAAVGDQVIPAEPPEKNDDATEQLIAKLRQYSLGDTASPAPKASEPSAAPDQIASAPGIGSDTGTRPPSITLSALSSDLRQSPDRAEKSNSSDPDSEHLITYEPPEKPAPAPETPSTGVDDTARSIEDLLKELSAIHFEEHLNAEQAPSADQSAQGSSADRSSGRSDSLRMADSSLDDTTLVETFDVEQKLDLARAYVDMADLDQARAILDDIVLLGTPEQQREAEELLARLKSPR